MGKISVSDIFKASWTKKNDEILFRNKKFKNTFYEHLHHYEQEVLEQLQEFETLVQSNNDLLIPAFSGNRNNLKDIQVWKNDFVKFKGSLRNC